MSEPQFQSANVSENPSLQQWLSNRVDGKAMRRLKIARESLLASIKATGQAQPATILNFNPVALRLDGGINFKVPSIIDSFVKAEDQFIFPYRGRKFRASILTIHEPILFSQITDVKKVEDVEVGEYAMKACKQIEVAHCFLTAYTYGLESSSGMGGVVVFEGTRHVLDRDKNPAKITVKVPKFISLADRTREYFTEEANLGDLIEEAIEFQKKYATVQTQQAQSFWDNDDMRMNITDVHRIWHQYEMDMGYRHKAAPWITMMNEPMETCAGCGTQKKAVEAYFCVCGRAYDPLKAYFAGELPISSDQMARVDANAWTKVHAEENRRKSLREGKAAKPESDTK